MGAHCPLCTAEGPLCTCGSLPDSSTHAWHTGSHPLCKGSAAGTGFGNPESPAWPHHSRGLSKCPRAPQAGRVKARTRKRGQPTKRDTAMIRGKRGCKGSKPSRTGGERVVAPRGGAGGTPTPTPSEGKAGTDGARGEGLSCSCALSISCPLCTLGQACHVSLFNVPSYQVARAVPSSLSHRVTLKNQAQRGGTEYPSLPPLSRCAVPITEPATGKSKQETAFPMSDRRKKTTCSPCQGGSGSHER